GETVRQIVLGGDSFSRPYPVSQILSEGEKRVVAISDFLAEVSLDKNCSTVVLDDPVTSLDVQWKDTIALCLAELAKVKQVVIFTHDLAFMYSIKSHADELLVPIVSHWIKDEDGHPGFVYQDNSPACEKDYKSARKAQELYAKTKGMPPEEQQRIMQQAFGALRTSYEALIIFELFNGVVERFEERIRFDRLAQVRIDTELVDQIIKRMGALSRHIDAHLHSDNYSPVKPTPADLLEEINLFEEIRKKQRELKPKK
ncbi:MAG: AAA family ATPase, partial [Nitrososphaerales archaeon]